MSEVPLVKHILLVEDSEINQIVFTRLISGEDVTYHMCADGIEAIDYLHSKPEVSFILMDCEMPRMNGYECTKELLKLYDGHYSNVPVVAATANESTQEIDKCLSVGMVDVLTKPFSKPQLLAMLNKYS